MRCLDCDETLDREPGVLVTHASDPGNPRYGRAPREAESIATSLWSCPNCQGTWISGRGMPLREVDPPHRDLVSQIERARKGHSPT